MVGSVFRAFGFLVGIAVLAWPTSASARDSTCAAGPAIASADSTDALLTAAQALLSETDRPRARALYLAILARDPKDDDAAVGLARFDSKDGCLALAERSLREVLARSPANVEARMVLSDVLAQHSRWHEANAVIAAGREGEPLSPDLLSRSAKIAASEGDATLAQAFATEAERVAPLDPEVREARDRYSVGQARLGQRFELFPTGYDNVYTTTFSAMQRWHHWRFEVGTTVVNRHGAIRSTRSGPQATSIVDGRPDAGAYWHYDDGGYIGLSVAGSAPATSLPRYAASVSALVPFGRRVSVSLATTFWRYADDRNVAILSPALVVAIAENVDLTGHYWFTSVTAAGLADSVHSVGGRVTARPLPSTTLGVDYTYGVQLDRNPSAADLLQLRSHIVTLFGRHLLLRSFGLDASVSFERRSSLGSAPNVVGAAFEVGIFSRW